ncbi:hypothetical protein GOP47_0028739 [Adiantum capillus-veneris]|nr:hypothetical protein GOP47_0028739 [Adiantum capillus-veneris]
MHRLLQRGAAPPSIFHGTSASYGTLMHFLHDHWLLYVRPLTFWHHTDVMTLMSAAAYTPVAAMKTPLGAAYHDSCAAQSALNAHGGQIVDDANKEDATILQSVNATYSFKHSRGISRQVSPLEPLDDGSLTYFQDFQPLAKPCTAGTSPLFSFCHEVGDDENEDEAAIIKEYLAGLDEDLWFSSTL